MTTLSDDAYRVFGLGDVQAYGVIASDIIYSGAAVGLVGGTGYSRPLNASDRFAGFAEDRVDNSTGAAGAKDVRVKRRGQIEMTVAGAVITDVGQPVYATDDDTFTLSPVGGVFIGFVSRFVSSGVCIVEFDVSKLEDPYGEYTVRELISGNKTLDSEDSGKLFWVDTDAAIITLPAVATPVFPKIINGGAFGAVAVTLSPSAADTLEGPDITAIDDKDVINTKATARRGDFAVIGMADAAGHTITELRGTWAREA